MADGSGTGNIDVPATVGTDVMNFIVDDASPTATLSWPGANAVVSSAAVQMTGTAADDASGSGVNTIQVEISTGTGGAKQYWTGGGWQSGQIWITTSTANPWFYTISNTALLTGIQYYLRVQDTDVAGNTFTLPTSTFTYNTTAPTVTITPNAPNNGFYSQVQVSTPLAGTSSPSGAPAPAPTTWTCRAARAVGQNTSTGRWSWG